MVRPLSAMRAFRSYVARPFVNLSTRASTIMLPGPVSKAKTSSGARFCGNHGDVGDASDVKRHATETRVAIKQVVNEWDERRALSTRGDITGAKIADGWHSGTFGNHAQFANLQRRRDAARAESNSRCALMVDSLAVRADQRNSPEWHLPATARLDRRFCEPFSEQKIQLANFSSGGLRVIRDAQNPLSHLRRERNVVMSCKFCRNSWAERRKCQPGRRQFRRRTCQTSGRSRASRPQCAS